MPALKILVLALVTLLTACAATQANIPQRKAVSRCPAELLLAHNHEQLCRAWILSNTPYQPILVH